MKVSSRLVGSDLEIGPRAPCAGARMGRDWAVMPVILPELAARVMELRSNGVRSSRRFCVQVVYKKEVLKGPKLDLSNAESTTDS
jgi:hypothetical protein